MPVYARLHLTSGLGESVKPDDLRLTRSEVRMIATPQQALEAAARVARDAGLDAHILGDALEGEARDVGTVLAGIALQVAEHGQEDIAGALLAPDSLARAWAKGIKPQDALSNNDGHGFFGALGDSVITGLTLTNVNGFRALLIEAEAAASR